MVLAEQMESRPPSLVYWPGAKAKFRGELVNRLALVAHDRYVEPFCGAAWVLLTKRRVANEWLNDSDGELINFFRVLADREGRQALEARLQFVGLHARQLLDDLVAMPPEEVAALDPLDRAARFLQVNRIGRGRGVWTESQIGDPPSRWDDVLRDAWQMANRLRAVHIEHGDGVELIRKLDLVPTLYYLDPPYLDERKGRASADLTLHRRLSATLGTLRGHFLLTHPQHAHWDEAAKVHGWEQAELGREYNLDGTYRTIWMFANFPLSSGHQGSLFA